MPKHCDGNHAPPPCGAQDCLHSTVPVVLVLETQLKCDGNHGGDPCDDPHCWQREEPWPWPNTKAPHA